MAREGCTGDRGTGSTHKGGRSPDAAVPRASTGPAARVRVHAIGALNAASRPIVVVGDVAAARAVVRTVVFVLIVTGRRGIFDAAVAGTSTGSPARARVHAV